MLPDDAGQILLPIARAAIANALGQGVSVPTNASWLQETGACFVTLTQAGALRGCIGSLEARRSLLSDLMANAVAAALRDPRFAPLSPVELESVRVEVSVLSPRKPLAAADEAYNIVATELAKDSAAVSTSVAPRPSVKPMVASQMPSAPR